MKWISTGDSKNSAHNSEILLLTPANDLTLNTTNEIAVHGNSCTMKQKFHDSHYENN